MSESYQRAILHLDLDAFFVAVEQLRNDRLRNIPLIVGGSSDRGVVSSCSYEARAFGVRSGMPMRQAMLLCPDATVVRGDMEAYSKHSALVREVIADQAPLFEQASIDEFYLDLTGMDQHFGCLKWSRELRTRITRETGLPLSFGLSVNKTVSKVGAGEAKPAGEKMVPAGQEKMFLAPLPVDKIPAVGRETARRLAVMGVRTCHTLQQIPPQLLVREFGKNGLLIWKKANGEDDSPVVPYREQDSISTENTFHSDTIDMVFLRNEIRKQTSKLASELRDLNKLTSCVTVKIRYSDFNTFTRQCTLPYTAQDTALTEQALTLFESLYERRQAIRLVGVKFSKLVRGSSQLSLFDETAKEARLLQAMDAIHKRWGKNSVQKGFALKNKKP